MDVEAEGFESDLQDNIRGLQWQSGSKENRINISLK